MKSRLRALLSCALFFCFCYFIFYITDPSAAQALIWPGRFSAYADLALMPGADILDILQNQTNLNLIFNNLAGNIILFGPVGFLVPLCWPYWRKLHRTVAFGAGQSLVIELCQLCNLRATVTDDLLLNTLGTVFGYLCFALLARLSGRMKEGATGKWPPLRTTAAALLLYNLIDLAQYVHYVL